MGKHFLHEDGGQHPTSKATRPGDTLLRLGSYEASDAVTPQYRCRLNLIDRSSKVKLVRSVPLITAFVLRAGKVADRGVGGGGDYKHTTIVASLLLPRLVAAAVLRQLSISYL